MAYVLYHGACYDGMGAAWAAKQGLEFRDRRRGGDTFIPCNYGAPCPSIPDGQEVYLVDFSFPRPILEALAARSKSLMVLDHHKTAQAALEGFPHCVFDMNRSGAVITWQYFLPNEDVPLLLKYIQDRDLWRFELPKSHEVDAYIQSYARTLQDLSWMNSEIGADFHVVVTEGAAILRFRQQKVKEICDMSTIFKTIGGYENIPVTNTTCFQSEVGHELLERYQEAPFVAYYSDRGDGVQQWGLRSRKDFDCSVVAQQYGGGGHAQACGFTVGGEKRI